MIGNGKWTQPLGHGGIQVSARQSRGRLIRLRLPRLDRQQVNEQHEKNAFPGHASPEKASELPETPMNVPVVSYRALIAPVSYLQGLQGAVGGLSIPHRTRGVKRQSTLGSLALRPTGWFSRRFATLSVESSLRMHGEGIILKDFDTPPAGNLGRSGLPH